MDNLREFNAVLDKFAGASADAVPLIQKRLGFAALIGLIRTTPVGNPDLWKINVGSGRVGNADRLRGDYDYAGADYVGGHARRNWQATTGAPASGTVAGTDAPGVETQALGKAVISTAPPFCELWMTNNLPYIERLEDGHSTQAPRGMLRITFADLVRKYSTVADQVLRDLKL